MQRPILISNLFILLVFLAAFPLASAPTKEALQAAAMLKSAFSPGGPFGEIKPTKGSVQEATDPAPVPASISDSDFDRTIGIFSRAFYLSEFMGKARVEVDSFLLPNPDAGTLNVDWKSVKTVSGAEVMAAEQEKKTDSSIPKSLEIELTGVSDEDPLYEATGEATLQIPNRFERIDIGEKDRGRKLTLGSNEVELLQMENDTYKIKVKNVNNEDLSGIDLQVIPFGSGGRLKQVERNEGPSDFAMPPMIAQAIADLESGRRTAAQVEEELNSHREELEKIGRTSPRVYAGRATGRIQSLAIVLSTSKASRTFHVVATTKPEMVEGKPGKVRAPRYKNVSIPSFVALDRIALQKKIQIRAKRSNAMYGFNTPEIECVLPAVANSHYASIEFSGAKLLNAASRPVPFELEESGYMAESYSSEIRFQGKNGASSPVFAKATGKVHIRYPLVVKTVSYRSTDSENPLGVAISGSQISFHSGSDDASDSSGIPEVSSGPVSSVRAYDATGRELVQLTYTKEGDGNESITTIFFWGEPVRVEIDRVEQWDEMDLNYNLPPAPRLPPQ